MTGAGNPEFLKDQGNALKAEGDLEGAVECYRQALAIAPEYAAARYNLGLTLRELGRLAEAESQFRQVLQQDSRDVDALFNLADLLSAQSRYDESARAYRAAVELAPGNPYLWLGLGIAHNHIPGEMEESLRCLRRSIEIMPDFAEAHFQVGNVLSDAGQLDEAAGHFLKAIASSPGHAQRHTHLANIMMRQGRQREAIAGYRKAIEIDPDLAYAHLNLGSACSLAGEYTEAREQYEQTLRLQPDNVAARGCLLFEMQRMCDWSRFEELAEAQRRGAATRPEQDVLPFHLFSIPSTPREQLLCARNYAVNRARAVSRDRERLNFRHDQRPKPRLRIGYLSADFREHPGAYLIPELIELHDRTRFEIVGYSYGPDDGSAIRARLARTFDRFVDLSPLSHAGAAARIHGDGVDILLDLSGYTTFARTEILALRPAPIQVNFLGYPGTLGADYIDYLVTNRFVTPPERAADYSEALVYMPGSYQVNDRKRSVADMPPRRSLGLPDDAIVFCCLNQTSKILPDVYAAWMRLLKALPGSVVWLVDTSPQAVANLRREAQELGIGPERLVFAPRVPIAQHLGRLRAADLFLDTFPYNAHSTASDALWVGLPVLTRAGETFASRAAGSQLTAIGVPELITFSMEEYEAAALRLAQTPAELAALREKLSRNRQTSALFDTPGYVQHLEAAFQRMWSGFLAGNAPRAIQV